MHYHVVQPSIAHDFTVGYSVTLKLFSPCAPPHLHIMASPSRTSTSL